jgi:hypothetical protein
MIYAIHQDYHDNHRFYKRYMLLRNLTQGSKHRDKTLDFLLEDSGSWRQYMTEKSTHQAVISQNETVPDE